MDFAVASSLPTCRRSWEDFLEECVLVCPHVLRYLLDTLKGQVEKEKVERDGRFVVSLGLSV